MGLRPAWKPGPPQSQPYQYTMLFSTFTAQEVGESIVLDPPCQKILDRLTLPAQLDLLHI